MSRGFEYRYETGNLKNKKAYDMNLGAQQQQFGATEYSQGQAKQNLGFQRGQM